MFNIFLGIEKTIVDQANNYNKLFEGMKKEFRVTTFYFTSFVPSSIQTQLLKETKRNCWKYIMLFINPIHVFFLMIQ